MELTLRSQVINALSQPPARAGTLLTFEPVTWSHSSQESNCMLATSLVYDLSLVLGPEDSSLPCVQFLCVHKYTGNGGKSVFCLVS